MRHLRPALLLALASAALSAHAAVVNFDAYTPVETKVNPLDSEGLTFTASYDAQYIWGDNRPGARNGTQSLIYGFSSTTITRTGGGAFTFGGLDYGQSFFSVPTDPLTVTLNLVGGGVQVFSLTSTQSFQTLTTTAEVTSVTLSQNSGYVAIDNVRFNEISSAVPGPAAALPFALMALRRRKRA